MKDTIAPVYLLWGPDRAAIHAFVEGLRATVLQPPGLEAFNHESFDAARMSAAAEFLNACEQVPMMAKHRLVELASPEEFGRHKRLDDADGEQVGLESKREAAVDALIEYFDKPNPSTVLVITSGGINGTSRLVKAAKKSKQVVERKFEPPQQDADGVAQLLAEALRRDIPLGRSGAEALVDAVGTMLSDLLPALERAAAFADGKVERVHVEAVVATTRESNVFDLTDAIGRGQHVRALEILARMFSAREKDTGQAMRLFGMLLWQLRRLCIAKFARDPVGALGGGFGAKKLQEQAAGFDEQRLRAAYAGLARLDADFKGGSKVAYESPYMAIQRWVLETCGGMPGVEPR